MAPVLQEKVGSASGSWGLSERATDAAPGLTNVIAVVTETGAWRVLGGSGDVRIATRLLRTAVPHLAVGAEALTEAGPRAWILRFGGKGSMRGCAVLMADHDRSLPAGELVHLRRFADEAAAVLTAARERERAILAERWHVAITTLPRLIHAAGGQEEMLHALGTVIELALPSSQWAIVLRGVGRQPFRLDAGGPGEVLDTKPFIVAARRAVDLDGVDVDCPQAGRIVGADTAVTMAAPIRDRRMRCVGAVAIRVPCGGAVEHEDDAAPLSVLCDTLSLGIDLAEQTRTTRILQRYDPATGFVSTDLFRDDTAALSDACKVGNRTAAMILLQADAAAGDTDDGAIVGLLRRFAEEEAGTEMRIARLRAWRYAILAPDRSRRDAVMLAARLRWHLRTLGVPPIASSAGIAMIPDGGSSYDGILASATGALDDALTTGAGERIADPRPRVAGTQANWTDARQSIAMLQWLADLIDQKYFGGTSHSAAVAARAREIAVRLGASQGLVDQVTLAGRLHDIGRALLSPELFTTITPTRSERRLVQTHVVLGARLVTNAGFARAAECIAHMHERWDGGGEPQQLTADAIPLGARILAGANLFETVLGGHGRGECGMSAAIDAAASARGVALDPDVVDALLGTLRARRLPEPVAG